MVTLQDLPLTSYTPSVSVALAKAIAPLLNVENESLVVAYTEATPAPLDGTVAWLQLLTPGGGVDFKSAFQALFAAAVPASNLTAALVREGLSSIITLGARLMAPPPPVGSFNSSTQDLQIMLPMIFTSWSMRAYSYTPALTSALAVSLGVNMADIWVYYTAPAPRGGTIIKFTVAAASQSFESSGGVTSTKYVVQFASLFNHLCTANNEPGCSGRVGSNVTDGFATQSGDPASEAFLARLRAAGLQVATAYYQGACQRATPKAASAN